MRPDEHGGDLGAHPGVHLDFSISLNPLGLPPTVRQSITDGVDGLVGYPDPRCRELRAALAWHHGIPVSRILAGNGASDLLYRVCDALRPQRVLVAVPTFTEYERSASVCGGDVVRYPLDPARGFEVGRGFVDAITDDIDLVFCCQPNNPTGRLIAQSMLNRIIEQCRTSGAILVVDECFLNFTDAPSLAPMAADRPNLLVVRALTKSHALAGLRLGYAIGDPGLLARMADHGPRWSVSASAQHAGCAALREPDWDLRTRQTTRIERGWLTNALTGLGLEVVPSDANFLLFRCDAELFAPLLERGILIRSCANFPGLDATWWRVGVKNRAENHQLVAAIQEVLRGQ